MTARTPVQRQQSLAARKRAAGLREVRSLWAPLERHKAIRAMAADLAMQADALRYRKWRADYTGKEATDMLLDLADAWRPDQVDAAIDAAMAAEVKT